MIAFHVEHSNQKPTSFPIYIVLKDETVYDFLVRVAKTEKEQGKEVLSAGSMKLTLAEVQGPLIKITS